MNIIVIGGGAAGFFTAINAAQLNKNTTVTLLEKSSKLLSKVRISGGGRCNVTNACFDNSVLVKNYPRGEKELHNVFSRFNTKDTIEWFKQRGVELKTETDGRMFPITDSSQTIINCLMDEAKLAGVNIKLNVDIKEIKKSTTDFMLTSSDGSNFYCDKLIIAAGGNANSTAYEWIKKLGHTIIKPVPSLFTFNIPNNNITQLMGISSPWAKVKIKQAKLEIEGPLLITHWGMSGPAILKASAWGARTLSDTNYDFTINISWLPKFTDEKLKIEFVTFKEELATKLIVSTYPFELPKRLWEYFTEKAGINKNMRWADLSKKIVIALINIMLNDEYVVKGKTTFKEEFVTCGGIHLKEIDFKTMQSKVIPNLFFVGEILNIDGVTGGFNFQNAWSTGWVAAQALS
ncbi:MAG: NAD(P)/FAD-dependent oxidoreductase [Bacteroidia bacterium]